MDNGIRSGFFDLLAIGMNMSHNVVAADLLLCCGIFIINIILVSLEVCDLLIRDVQSEFFLCFSKCDPEFPPCCELLVRREDELHLGAGIS